MPAKQRLKRKDLFKSFIGYGLHLWLLLLLSNVFLLYSLHFISFGANSPGTNSPTGIAISPSQPVDPSLGPSGISLSQVPSSTPTTAPPTSIPQPTATPTPAGPIISLSFSVPGIGSGGGNLKPLRPVRNVTIYLYPTDVNSFDNSIKPLFTIKGQVKFDPNFNNPTYTAFVNHTIDLGAAVPEGEYQIAFKTDQSLRKLIKEKEENAGGKLFEVRKSALTETDLQSVIIGDISPSQGNNIMDIDDYFLFASCFGNNWNTTACPNNKIADFNDDGKVDGVDYNIMLQSYNTLLSLGFPVPSLPPLPFPTNVSRLSEVNKKAVTPKKKPVASSSAKQVVQQSSGSGIGGLIFFIFFLGLVGGVLFFLEKRNKFVTNLIAKIKPNNAAPPPATDQAAGDTTLPADLPPTPTPETPPDQSPPVETPPAEIPPVESPLPVATDAQVPPTETPPAEAPAVAAPPVETPAAPNPTDANSVDATYYVKKKSVDEANNIIWVTLTGEEGALEGKYAGKEISEGFIRIKGTHKEEGGKKFIEITDVLDAE